MTDEKFTPRPFNWKKAKTVLPCRIIPAAFSRAVPKIFPAPRVGLTGTRRYVEELDLRTVSANMLSICPADTVLITGGCDGFDGAAMRVGRQMGLHVHTVVPADRSQMDPNWEGLSHSVEFMPEGTTFLERDDVVVLRSEVVYAFPFETEDHSFQEWKTGTWATARRARNQNKFGGAYPLSEWRKAIDQLMRVPVLSR